jgi:hypothetical protein
LARTTDSLQQTGPQISSNGGGIPQYINVTNMGFENLRSSPATGVTLFLLEAAQNCRITNCAFYGSLNSSSVTGPTLSNSGIRFSSPSATLGIVDVAITGCLFSGTTWGINNGALSKGISVSNSAFNTLYQGVYLSAGVGGAYNVPTGVRISANSFDLVYAEGVYFDSGVSLCASTNNIFYDVGNWLNGAASPQLAMLFFSSSNNVSFGDLFDRSNLLQETIPCVALNDKQSISTTNGTEMSLGTYNIISGTSIPKGLVSSTIASNATVVLFVANPSVIEAFTLNYKGRKPTQAATRLGSIQVTCPSGGGEGSGVPGLGGGGGNGSADGGGGLGAGEGGRDVGAATDAEAVGVVAKPLVNDVAGVRSHGVGSRGRSGVRGIRRPKRNAGRAEAAAAPVLEV